MNEKYPKIDMYRTGQNIKRIMQNCGLTVRNIQEYLDLATPQSVYHWFEGHNMPFVDNLYALLYFRFAFWPSESESLYGSKRIREWRSHE